MSLQFENAQELAKKYPETFEAPTKEDINNLAVGGNAKICCKDERFWVLITAIDGDNFTGTVNNDLLNTDDHGLQFEDEVKFHSDNIYQTL